MGGYDKAIEDCDKAIELDPDMTKVSAVFSKVEFVRNQIDDLI